MNWASFGFGFVAACGVMYVFRVCYIAGRNAAHQEYIDKQMSELEQEIESVDDE